MKSSWAMLFLEAPGQNAFLMSSRFWWLLAFLGTWLYRSISVRLHVSFSAGRTSLCPSLSWTLTVAELVKNPPAMRETRVCSLGWGDLLEKGTGYPLQCSGLENPMDCIGHGITKSQIWATFTSLGSFLDPTWIVQDKTLNLIISAKMLFSFTVS